MDVLTPGCTESGGQFRLPLMHIHEIAGQTAFLVDSEIAAHSIWCVIGKRSAWMRLRISAVQELFGGRDRGDFRAPSVI